MFEDDALAVLEGRMGLTQSLEGMIELGHRPIAVACSVVPEGGAGAVLFVFRRKDDAWQAEIVKAKVNEGRWAVLSSAGVGWPAPKEIALQLAGEDPVVVFTTFSEIEDGYFLSAVAGASRSKGVEAKTHGRTVNRQEVADHGMFVIAARLQGDASMRIEPVDL